MNSLLYSAISFLSPSSLNMKASSSSFLFFPVSFFIVFQKACGLFSVSVIIFSSQLAYVDVCLCVYDNLCMYVCMYVPVYVCVFVCVCVCVFLCVYMCVSWCVCENECACDSLCMCLWVSVWICVFMCSCACMCVHGYVYESE